MESNQFKVNTVVIPIRGFHSSMSRLRGFVDEEKVTLVAKKLFYQTLDVFNSTSLEIYILTSDEMLKSEIENKYPNPKIKIDDGNSLNKALNEVVEDISSDEIMIVMPDLPKFSKEVLQKLMKMNEMFRYVIAPTIDDGTAAAILPKELYRKNYFGLNSSKKIIDYCNINSIPISQIVIQDITMDLDTYEDWAYWEDYLNKHYFNSE